MLLYAGGILSAVAFLMLCVMCSGCLMTLTQKYMTSGERWHVLASSESDEMSMASEMRSMDLSNSFSHLWRSQAL